MDLDNYKFRYDAYKNNTFDLDVVEKTLEESKMSAYQYLRQFQLDSTGYRRFDFKMQEIYKTNKVNHSFTLIPRRWVFYVDYEFINVGNRLNYKRSTSYEKDLSFDHIISRPDLFDSTFLVFINGLLYTKGISVLCKEDKTYMIFTCREEPSPEGFTMNQMKEFIETNADVSIFFIPNTGIKSLSTNAYRMRTLNLTTGIPKRNLNLSELVDYTGSLSFINPKNEVFSLPINTEIKDEGIYVDDNDINDIINSNPNNTAVNIQIIPLRNLLTKVHVERGHKWFMIPMQDYPVAIENCLVFDDEGKFIHDAKLNHHYPNVYSINGIDDIIENNDLYIYVFYYENKQNKLKHLNMLDTYHKYMPNLIERYENGSIPDDVLNFEPDYVDYTIKNFQQYELYDDHFKYKIGKMKEYIRADVNNFRRYLRNLGLGNNYYYVDVSKIDLEQRKRMDTSDTGMPIKTFEEEMYMFVFRNDFRGMYEKLLIHIDGLRYNPKHLYRGDMLDFLYIPCRLIKEDTVIEIEKLSDVIRELKFKSTRKSDIISIDIGEYAVRNKTLYNDLFIVDKETNEYLDPSSYQIIIPIKLHIEDMESDVVLDYIISESDQCYYYLRGIEEGRVELVREDNVEEDIDAFYLRARDNNTVYQFDVVDEENISFNEVDVYENIISRIRSMDSENIVYQFKVINGQVQIEVNFLEESKASRGIIAYGGLDVIDLGEVFLPCNQKVKVKIIDEKYLGRDLLLEIKKNFKTEIAPPFKTAESFKPITINTTCKNDERYFKIYRNNRLLPRHLTFAEFHPQCNTVDIYPGYHREEDDQITIECMPYMMTQACYIKEIPKDKVIDLTGLIDKPFDFKWYDVYLNGRKLVKKDIEIISANKIKILKAESMKGLELVENSRDKEYFGYKPIYDILDYLYDIDPEFRDNVNGSIIQDNIVDDEIPVVNDVVTRMDFLINQFFNEFILVNFGMINPDIDQIPEDIVNRYNKILQTPFELNADKYGRKYAAIVHNINPDNTK